MLALLISKANTKGRRKGDPEIGNGETGDMENFELPDSIGPPFLIEKTLLPICEGMPVFVGPTHSTLITSTSITRVDPNVAEGGM